MDPQHALALRLVDDALADAGVERESLAGTRTGVYVGLWDVEHRPSGGGSVYDVLGSNPSLAAGRISYAFDLRGPSKVINTACASSLEAVLAAATDLQLGRSEWGVAGGVKQVGRRWCTLFLYYQLLRVDV